AKKIYQGLEKKIDDNFIVPKLLQELWKRDIIKEQEKRGDL
ncbi:657_t:CDS:1, partial [Gigaspora rosea]